MINKTPYVRATAVAFHEAWESGDYIESSATLDYSDLPAEAQYINQTKFYVKGEHNDWIIGHVGVYINIGGDEIEVQPIYDIINLPPGDHQYNLFEHNRVKYLVSQSGINTYIKVTVKSKSTTAFEWSAALSTEYE